MNYRISDAIKDIKAGKCILVIGPDIHDFGEKTFFELFCQELPSLEGHEEVIDSPRKFSEYVFLNEELIQIKSEPQSGKRIAKLLEGFYESQTMLDEPLRKVAQIPFPMIISLMPDMRLSRIFDEQKLPYEFSYLPISGANPVNVQPSANKPLLYNILGNLDVREAVITFDSMFDLLKNIIENKLPAVVSHTLAGAKAVLFLGIHFERWHTQLLLKVIGGGGFNYTTTKQGKKDTSTFVTRRLQLDLLNNDPEHFLNELYEACATANLLKTVQYTEIGSIFLSYSHHDKELAKQLADALRKESISVVMDETNLVGGGNIEKFIQEIKNVDMLIPLISEYSLFRPYVIQEIYTAISNGYYLLPALIDEILLNKDIYSLKDAIIEKETAAIADELIKNIKNRVPDLITAQTQWADFNGHFSIVVDELKKIKNVPVELDDLSLFVAEVIKTLAVNQKNANIK